MDKILLGIIGGAIIGIIVLIAVSDFQFDIADTNDEKTVLTQEMMLEERRWIKSGPFWMDKRIYDVGESVFMRVGTLQDYEKGDIIILRELNSTHYTVWKKFPFDGSEKSSFNFYFTPILSKTFDICEKDDISGQWRIVFTNTNYQNIEFEFTDKILEGSEKFYNTAQC